MNKVVMPNTTQKRYLFKAAFSLEVKADAWDTGILTTVDCDGEDAADDDADDDIGEEGAGDMEARGLSISTALYCTLRWYRLLVDWRINLAK